MKAIEKKQQTFLFIRLTINSGKWSLNNSNVLKYVVNTFMEVLASIKMLRDDKELFTLLSGLNFLIELYNLD